MAQKCLVPICTGIAKGEEIIASVGDGVTVHDQEFRIIYQNQAMKDLFGDCAGKLCHEAYQQSDAVCPGCPVALCFSSGEVHTVERIVTIADRTAVFETCASPIRDRSGTIVAVVEVVRNATKRKEAEDKLTRLKNLYEALSHTNKAIMHISDRNGLFRQICAIAVEYGNFPLAVIDMPDPETGFVRPVAWCGEAADYLNHLPDSPDIGHGGGGLTGMALREGVFHVCNDLHDDPLAISPRIAAGAHGIRSSAAFPITQDRRAIGAFSLYSGHKGFFDPETVNLLREMAENISFALNNFSREQRRKSAEEALRSNEERLQLVLEGSNDGFLDWDIEAGSVNLSCRLFEMLGYAPGEIRPTIRAVFELIHPDDKQRVRTVMYDQLSRTSSPFGVELRMITKGNEFEWVCFRGKVVSRDENGIPSRVSGTISNITEKKRSEESLQYISMHDPLTGLFNRGYFETEMSRMEQSRQYPVSIVLADIDGLKAVNDRFGHTEGDRLIKQASQVLRQSFRAEDVIARIGGDEFAVILHLADAHTVKDALKRVRKCQSLLNEGNGDFPLSVSLGAATAERNEQLHDAFKLADSRMYRHKSRQKLRRLRSVEERRG